MPKVPQLEQQVAPQGIPNARLGPGASPQSYGAGVGETTRRIGLALYEQEAISADQTAVFEADRQAADLQSQLEQKLRQAKGKNALGIEDPLRKEWGDGIAQIESSLSSDRQRNAFSRIRATRGDQLNKFTQQHVATEVDRFQDEETEAGVKSVFDRVRANPDQPEVIAGEIQRANSLLAAAAQRKGWMGTVTEAQIRNPEFRKAYEDKGEPVPSVGDQYLSDAYTKKRADVLSLVHSSVINGFLAKNDDLSAQAYFKAHANDLNVEQRDRLEKIVLEGSTIGHARRIVNGWIDKGKPEEFMLDQARVLGEDNPKMGTLLREYATQHFADQQRLNKEHEDRTYELSVKGLKQVIAQDPGTYHDPREVFGLDRFLRLRPEIQSQLEHIAKEAINPTNRVNNDDLYLQFRDLEHTPEKLGNLSLREFHEQYWQHFDNQHRERATEIWSNYREAMAKKEQQPQKFEKLFSNKEMFDTALELSGYFPVGTPLSKWSDDQKAVWRKVEEKANIMIRQLPEGTAPDLIQKKLHELVDTEIKATYKVDPGFFSRSKEVPSVAVDQYLEGARSVKIPLQQIDPARQDVLRGILKQRGVRPTDERVERLEAVYRLFREGKIKTDQRDAMADQIFGK